MNIRILVHAFFLLLLPALAMAWEDGEVKFPGTINNWDTNAASAAKYTGPDGFPDWFRYTGVSTNTGAMELKLLGFDWATAQWADSTVTKDDTSNMNWFFDNQGIANSTVSGDMTSGFHYVFTARDPIIESNATISVMELSDAPELISSASGGTGSYPTNAGVEITVTLEDDPPPEQNVFVRYTTDGWSSFSIVAASISSNVATAVITNLVGNTVYEWYALSSTASEGQLAAAPGLDIDFLTLSWANNGGTNYQFGTPGDAAWVWHNDNRVTFNGSNVQVWVKIGYADSDGSAKWIDNAVLYYTDDDSEPAGSLGVGSGATQVLPMTFSHAESDASPLGDAMWWVGTLTNLDIFQEIKYKIGVWHGDVAQERFADYQSGVDDETFSFQIAQPGEPELFVNGLSANYTTSKFFVDEVAGDTHPVHIVFRPKADNPITDIEVFSNLNRRDYATNTYLRGSDLVEEGIWPPDGNTITTNDTDRYYRAYPMDTVIANQEYDLTLDAEKTGAYRLTARYKTTENTNWTWYTDFGVGRRDHAITVSPTKSRDIVMYEINTLNVSATGPSLAERSTFEDLHGGDGAVITNRVNLDYLQGLGVNTLWFQPIHPNHEDGRETDPDTEQPYELGSPYAVKNFFEIMPQMSRGNTRPDAMEAFTNFVVAASDAGINIMLDAAFNHTAYDAELADLGVELFATNSAATSEFRNVEARFYSRNDDYSERASGAHNIAVAPDRFDFGKWNDVYDVYFGRYAALVPTEAEAGRYNNEEDWFDYSHNWDEITRNVWLYFSEYIPYWLEKTGHPAGTPPEESHKGIDGLRADFGQGLPPQAWEYIINKARAIKWDFVFMSESLDGGAPTYRSNRHFDILNENIVFGLQGATTATAYRDIMEGRRNAYGQGLVLLNSVSHDEANYADPWQALIRFAANSAVDGAPMIFYGQELGISDTWGFSRYELNFGKYIPHFKKYNSMDPIWQDSTFGNLQLYPVYAAINRARHQSPALRSSNRFYLNQTGGGGPQQSIHSVGKYEVANGSPAATDVVFAFANLDRWNGPSGNFEVNIDQNGQNLFGIKTGRVYNVKNLAAYTNIDPNRNEYWLWTDGGEPDPRTGQDILDNGIFVSMNRVPQSEAEWTTGPYEAQYLKVYDVSAPPAATNAPAQDTGLHYAIGNTATFTWDAVVDPEGGEVLYAVIVDDGSTVMTNYTTNTSYEVTGSFGDEIAVTVQPVNPHITTNTGGASPESEPVTLLDPDDDDDGDNMLNWKEDLAGTDPMDDASVFEVSEALSSAGNTERHITFTAQSDRMYRIYYTDDALTDDPVTWTPFAAPAEGEFTNNGTEPVTHTFVDDEGPDTTGGAPAAGVRFYRLEVEAAAGP